VCRVEMREKKPAGITGGLACRQRRAAPFPMPRLAGF